MGAGSPQPLIRPGGRTLHGASMPRLQGRKTLASRLGSQPRERLRREEKPATNDDATLRRKRVWGSEAVE